MFGYACDETPQLMPAPIYCAHRLVERQAQLRKDGRLPLLRPDAKSQVTMRYADGKPQSIDTVVLSSQHAPDVTHEQFYEGVIEEIIKPVLPKDLMKDTKYLVNPTGRFVVGGPQGDCGLTGRKIIVDTYGGAARTAAARSRARTLRRSTARLPTPRATSPRTSSPPASPGSARSRSPTRSGWRGR